MAGYSYSVKRPVGRVFERTDDEVDLIAEGVVLTRHGMAWVCSNTYEKGKKGHTTIHFMHAGRLHVRSFDRYYTPQYLVTLAARFAKEIANADT